MNLKLAADTAAASADVPGGGDVLRGVEKQARQDSDGEDGEQQWENARDSPLIEIQE
jgi:hypothetical protein